MKLEWLRKHWRWALFLLCLLVVAPGTQSLLQHWFIWEFSFAVCVIEFLIVFIINSLRFLKANEMGVRVTLGRKPKFCDSGIVLVPWLPFTYLARYTKKRFNFDFEARTVVTKAGEYEEVSYGAQVLKVDSVAYLAYPRGDGLVEIHASDVPADEKELEEWVDDIVIGTLRQVFAKRTWPEAIELTEAVERAAKDLFSNHDAFTAVQFKKEDLDLTIKEVKLPKEIEEALPKVDTQRLKAEAAPYKAQERAEETMGALLESFNRQTGIPLEDIKKEFARGPEAFVRKHKSTWEKVWDAIYRDMALDGDSFLDIRTQNLLTDLVALWHAAQRRFVPPAGGEKKQEKPKEPTEMTDEELLERFEREEGI